MQDVMGSLSGEDELDTLRQLDAFLESISTRPPEPTGPPTVAVRERGKIFVAIERLLGRWPSLLVSEHQRFFTQPGVPFEGASWASLGDLVMVGNQGVDEIFHEKESGRTVLRLDQYDHVLLGLNLAQVFVCFALCALENVVPGDCFAKLVSLPEALELPEWTLLWKCELYTNGPLEAHFHSSGERLFQYSTQVDILDAVMTDHFGGSPPADEKMWSFGQCMEHLGFKYFSAAPNIFPMPYDNSIPF